MVSDQVLEGFGQFITRATLQEIIDTEVETRVARQLQKYGEMVQEIEKKATPLDLSKTTIVSLLSPGTWTKPAGFNRFRVICIGGGAGGAAGHYDFWLAQHYGAHGGGGGACAERLYTDAELPPTVTYGIGGGGIGRVNGGNGPGAGTAGGDTWFGTGSIEIRAGGGKPGSTPTNSGGSNAPGGVATGVGATLLTGGYGGRLKSAGGPGQAGPFATYGGSAGGGGSGRDNGISTMKANSWEGGRSGTLLGGGPVTDTDGKPGLGTMVDPVYQVFQMYGGSGGGGGGYRKPGGKGGFPGGGGGGGGIDGAGGNGAAGCIHIIAYND